MTSAVAQRPAPSLFALGAGTAAPACPRCGSPYLVEDADPALLSCFACATWLRRVPGGALVPTRVPRVDTSRLPLPWRRPA